MATLPAGRPRCIRCGGFVYVDDYGPCCLNCGRYVEPVCNCDFPVGVGQVSIVYLTGKHAETCPCFTLDTPEPRGPRRTVGAS